MKALQAFMRANPVPTYAMVLSLFFLVGVVGHALPVTRPLMLAITPWFLLLTGLSALGLAWPRERRAAFALWVVLAWAITLSLEIIGVATGQIFGSYHYGPTLGLPVLGVPLIIGFNWVLVILAFASLSTGLPGARWWGGGPAALLATGFDWIMEPVAMRLDYWQWANSVIPLQNYLAWFLIGLVVGTSFTLSGLRLGGRQLVVLALVEAAFFAALRLIL